MFWSKRVTGGLAAWLGSAVMGWGAVQGGLLKFDCGPKEQPASPGYVTLSGRDVYNPERGYGWLKAWGLDWWGDSGKDGVLGSAIGAREHIDTQPDENDVTFRVDVPNGVYAVTVWVGSELPREGRLGICLAANGRVVLPPPGGGGWGVVTERTVPAVVEEGTLLLNYYVVGQGGAARLEIMGFTVEPVADPGKQAAMRAKWTESALKSEKQREVTIGGKTYKEVGRRREVPLGPMPGAPPDGVLLVFTRPNPGDILDYSIPRPEEIRDRFGAFAAPDEDQPVWFGVHALRDLKGVRVSCSDLTGTAGTIPAGEVELFNLTTRPRSMSDRPGSMITFAADLLDENAAFDVGRGRSQPVYLRIHVPAGTAPGVYSGAVTLAPEGDKPVELPLSLRVLPIALQAPRDKVWHIYGDAIRWVRMAPPEWRAEIGDMARHGINSLSVGYPPFGVAYIEREGRIVDADYGVTGEILQYAAQAGMNGPVIIGATPGIFWRFRGWSVGHTGAASHGFAEGQEGRALLLEHTAAGARSGADQAIGALLPPGETVRFEVRYLLKEGGGTATAGLTFMKTHKRDAVDEGKIALPLKPGPEWQTVSAVTRVPQEALYGRVGLSFAGGPGNVLIDDVKLVREGQTVNQVINPGFERDVALPTEDTVVWPEPFMREYVEAIQALGRAVERAGLTPWIEGTDEANGTPREMNEMRAARLSGLPTYCNLNPEAVGKMGTNLDAVCLYSVFLGKEQDCLSLLDTYHKRNQKLFFIASGAYVGQEFDWMPSRNHVGLCFWKSKADGTAVWTYQRPSADPFNDLDGEVKDYCMVFPPRKPGGKPVATLGWEGVREGWRDFRYVHTLEQTVAKAEKDGRAAAARLGRTVLAFIRDSVPWFDQAASVGYDNGSADRIRWLAAWTTLEVQAGKGAGAAVMPAGAKALQVTFTPPSAALSNAMLLCPPVEAPPVLDGRLDEPLWVTAASMGEFQNYMAPGVAARQKTEVFLCHDATNLYIGFRCFEPAMEQLKAGVTEHDGSVFGDDSIELFIDTRNDEFNFFQLAFNAAGTRFDQLCAGDNNAGANVFGANYSRQKVRDVKWTGAWTVKTSRHADRWEAEVALPFKTFGRESDLWGINICRNRKAGEAETSAWRVGGFFHQPKLFGKMLLAGARTGESAIRGLDLPLPFYGTGAVVMAVAGGAGLTGYVEVESKAGLKRRFPGTVNAGTASLPYRLDESTAAWTVVLEGNGRERHRFRMMVDVPAPIALVRAPKVLSMDSPAGTFQATIQLSDREQAARRFRVALCGPGGQVVDHVESPLGGTSCAVSVNLARFPQGMYSLAFSLTGPNGSTPIERLEPVILVPPYLNGQK